MKNGKIIKNAGLAIMILGLIFMVVAFIKSKNQNYVMGGLVVVSIGGFINYYGSKQLSKK